ncbi:MAG: DUF6391 domain-containing protein [Anaerolineae bacterium]
MGFFDIYPIINIRRNHGLEHATIHMLSERNPNLSLVGRSDLSGFTLYGAVDTEKVAQAAGEALQRLRGGQAELAIHPRCGTILATTGILTGLAAFMAISITGRPRKRFRWGTIPEAVLAATFAAIAAQPVGLMLQERFTVSGKPANLKITDIVRSPHPTMVIHRVNTAQ